MFENPIKLHPTPVAWGSTGILRMWDNILNTSAIMCYDGDVFPSDNSIATTTIFLMNETGVEPVLHI